MPIFELADQAWAGNTVNTVIFRHHGVLTVGRFQFCAFYVDASVMRVVRRSLADDALEFFDLRGQYKLEDAHNCISLGCDREGFLHIAYDCHASAVHYRRSTSPFEIGDWTAEMPFSGEHESTLTYPAFLQSPRGRPLMFLYRDGSAGDGCARLKVYSEQRRLWMDLPHPFLSGAGIQPWSSSPYWNRPVFDHEGNLHLSFVWRTHSVGGERRVNNVGIGYAKSIDGGYHWLTSRGLPVSAPMTQVNAETVFAVGPATNLINQCGMAVDSRGRPHIVFYSDDPNGIPQYQHLRWDGSRWHHQFLSQRGSAFALAGNGTLRIPISRPEIVLDRADHAYVIFRGDLSDDRMVAQRLLPPHYGAQGDEFRVLWDEPLGFAEPVIDAERWQRDGILSMLIQANLQPAHDRGVAAVARPVRLLDVDLARLWSDDRGAGV